MKNRVADTREMYCAGLDELAAVQAQRSRSGSGTSIAFGNDQVYAVAKQVQQCTRRKRPTETTCASQLAAGMSESRARLLRREDADGTLCQQ